MADYALLQARWKRVRPSGEPAEDVAVNTIHFQASSGGLNSGDVDLVDGEWQDMLIAIDSLFSGDYNPEERRYYDLPATAGPNGDPFDTRIGTLTGGVGSAAAELPPQCAVSVTWETAARRHWGRIYLPGFINSLTSHGRITSANLTVIGDAITTMGTNMRNAGNGIVVWDRAAWIPHDVTTFRIDDVVDVQRRRRLGQAFHRYLGSFV